MGGTQDFRCLLLLQREQFGDIHVLSKLNINESQSIRVHRAYSFVPYDEDMLAFVVDLLLGMASF